MGDWYQFNGTKKTDGQSPSCSMSDQVCLIADIPWPQSYSTPSTIVLAEIPGIRWICAPRDLPRKVGALPQPLKAVVIKVKQITDSEMRKEEVVGGGAGVSMPMVWGQHLSV